MISLEPEAASLFCKYLPIEKLQGAESGIGAFRPGSRYLVLDAGGKPKAVTAGFNQACRKKINSMLRLDTKLEVDVCN